MRQCVPYFGYRRHSITVKNYQVTYWDEGSGPPLVLVHGLGGCREYWAWVFPNLVRSFRVIALDLPGFGESAAPAREHLQFTNAVDLLHEFVTTLNLDQPLLIGHSMGGGLVLRCAARYPESFRGVMALCPPGFGREIDVVSRVLTLPVIGEMLFKPTHATIFSTLNCPTTTAGVEHLVRLTYERLCGPEARLRHLTILRQGVDINGQSRLFERQELASLTMPVKVVWGEQDATFPVKQAARVTDLLPHAEVMLVPAGHMIQLEQPNLLSQLIAEFATGRLAQAA
ncbi:MAG: alpha/beta fold hydrolase [Chloroflexi bacterium]|uniref:alpha/beta fold hydrolase n=1 Tax=Candidatus Flexifilum breve TaxID=3140694 RepID=UPI00313548B2|nr:alpha/beta fold hydrolase [Chloroflexota bacterium]